jgi:hypothetical protein
MHENRESSWTSSHERTLPRLLAAARRSASSTYWSGGAAPSADRRHRSEALPKNLVAIEAIAVYYWKPGS